jgi:hypothetical protein
MALHNLLPLQNRLVIVRHGESEANVAGLISSDPSISCTAHGLTAVGFEQGLLSVIVSLIASILFYCYSIDYIQLARLLNRSDK